MPERRRTLQIPLVTIALVAVVAAGFGVGASTGIVPTTPTPLELVAAGASYGPRTLDGDSWRIVTAAVVHAGWAHLVVNVLTMLVMGVALERRAGRAATAVVFVGASAVGTAAGTASAPYAVIAGASSGALGMAAALVVVMIAGAVRRGPRRTELVLLGVALAVIVGHVAMGHGRDDIDQVGHVAGVIAGLVMGIVIARARRADADADAHASAGSCAVALGIAAVAAIGIVLAAGPAPYEPRRATARLIAIEQRFDALVDGERESRDALADALLTEIVTPLEQLATDPRLDDTRMSTKLLARVARLQAYARARADVVRQYADAWRANDVSRAPAIEDASRAADARLDGPLP